MSKTYTICEEKVSDQEQFNYLANLISQGVLVETKEQLLAQALEALEESGNLLVFLSDHLRGRMGEGALIDMHNKGTDTLEVAASIKGVE